MIPTVSLEISTQRCGVENESRGHILFRTIILYLNAAGHLVSEYIYYICVVEFIAQVCSVCGGAI